MLAGNTIQHRNRWEDYIKKDLQEVGCGGIDWMELAQEREAGGEHFGFHKMQGIC
jgi:hypothetical protein